MTSVTTPPSFHETYDWCGPVDYVSNLTLGYDIGRLSGAKNVILATDFNPKSEPLLAALITGLKAAGVYAATNTACLKEELVHQVGTSYCDLGIYASGEIELGGPAGLQLIGYMGEAVSDDLIKALKEPSKTAAPPEVSDNPVAAPMGTPNQGFIKYMADCLEVYGNWPPEQGKHTVMLDPGNTNAGQVFNGIAKALKLPDNIQWYTVRDVTGMFSDNPNPFSVAREANMRTAMLAMDADIGLAWSGDGQRLRVYSKGAQPIAPVYVGGPLTAITLQAFNNETIVADERLVYLLVCMVSDAGGELAFERADSLSIRRTMQEDNAAFGMTVDGRYLFRQCYWNESGMLAAFLALHFSYCAAGSITAVVDHQMKLCSVHGPIIKDVFDTEHTLSRLNYFFDTDTSSSKYRVARDGPVLVVRSLTQDFDWRAVFTARENKIEIYMEGINKADRPFLEEVAETILSYMD